MLALSTPGLRERQQMYNKTAGHRNQDGGDLRNIDSRFERQPHACNVTQLLVLLRLCTEAEVRPHLLTGKQMHARGTQTPIPAKHSAGFQKQGRTILGCSGRLIATLKVTTGCGGMDTDSAASCFSCPDESRQAQRLCCYGSNVECHASCR